MHFYLTDNLPIFDMIGIFYSSLWTEFQTTMKKADSPVKSIHIHILAFHIRSNKMKPKHDRVQMKGRYPSSAFWKMSGCQLSVMHSLHKPDYLLNLLQQSKHCLKMSKVFITSAVRDVITSSDSPKCVRSFSA